MAFCAHDCDQARCSTFFLLVSVVILVVGRTRGLLHTAQPSTLVRSARVSDHEYEVRVGRAYDLLRATLPDFMRIGLVDYGESSEPKPRSSSMTLLDVLAFRSLRDRAAQDGLLGQAERRTDANRLSLSSQDPSDDVPAYHDDIHFRFCANASTSASSPTSDLTDEEAASLSFSGRNLYFASAQVLRHTLNILFSDPQVTIESIRRERRGATAAGELGRKRDSHSNDKDDHGHSNGPAECSSSRGDVIHVRVGFVGHLRVTGAEHRYTVKFRYDFDEDSGRIISHTVERIEPAIGRKLWSGLAAVWLRITGHQFPHAQPVANVLPATAHTDAVRSHSPFERK